MNESHHTLQNNMVCYINNGGNSREIKSSLANFEVSPTIFFILIGVEKCRYIIWVEKVQFADTLVNQPMKMGTFFIIQ